jgi:uncharacterized membrane protein AbrB (regulator of aidB expression)
VTITDKLIPVYVWFTYGFGTVQLPMGIVNLVLIITTLITVKGIYVPIWILPVVVVVVAAGCILLGYWFTKYGIWNRTTSYTNQNANPEIAKIHADIQLIKRHLGIPEDK